MAKTMSKTAKRALDAATARDALAASTLVLREALQKHDFFAPSALSKAAGHKPNYCSDIASFRR